jgi:hypothetical protein
MKSFKFLNNYNSASSAEKSLISPVFYRHSLENLILFTKELKQFRFVAAFGGQANDADTLQIKISTLDTFSKEKFEKFLSENLKRIPFLFYDNNTLSFSISGSKNGDPYILDEEDMIVAKKIEEYLLKNKIEVLDPPQDSWHCFCPKYYPDVF